MTSWNALCLLLWCCSGACGSLPALLCVAFAWEHLVKVLAGSFTGIQLPFWQCALAAKASAVLSWAALGKALPDAPGGDPSPWLSTAAARPGGVGSVLSTEEMWMCWRKWSQEPQRWWRAWGNSALSKGWESWGSLACRTEGLGRSFIFNICRNQLPQSRVQIRWNQALFSDVQRHN